VKKLVLEAYEESASEVIRRICDELVKTSYLPTLSIVKVKFLRHIEFFDKGNE